MVMATAKKKWQVLHNSKNCSQDSWNTEPVGKKVLAVNRAGHVADFGCMLA